MGIEIEITTKQHNMINIMNMISKRKLVAFAAIFICMLVHCNLVKAGTKLVAFVLTGGEYSGSGEITRITSLNPEAQGICSLSLSGFQFSDSQFFIQGGSNAKGNISVIPNRDNDVFITKVIIYGNYPRFPNITPVQLDYRYVFS